MLLLKKFPRRRLYSSLPTPTAKRRIADEGDWRYSAEWWGSQGGGFGKDEGHTVFQCQSLKGNGLVSVTAHPASIPTREHLPALERQLQQRYERFLGDHESCERLRILDYQWRVLRFNGTTRQSVAKVMAVYKDSDPSHVFLMQQPHCIAFPYVKSLVSAGLAALASTGFDLKSTIHGKQTMRILCIGHGGGTLPLFLASKIRGALVDVVEIDGAVISASVDAMGFPAVLKTDTRIQDYYSELSLHQESGHCPLLSSGFQFNKSSQIIDKVFWEDIQERIFLREADGETYICNSLVDGELKQKCSLWYDMVFLDAYDGDDIFPYKFRDRNGAFLTALQSKLHPKHGTVAINLHSDSPHPSLCERITGNYGPGFNPYLPLGRHVLDVCRAYREALQKGTDSRDVDKKDDLGLAFTVAVPCTQNISFVVSRGFLPIGNGEHKIMDHSGKMPAINSFFNKDLILKNLISQSQTVEDHLNLPFDCSQFVRRGFYIIS